MLLQHYRFLR